MSTYTQAHRPLEIKTPLGIDVLLLTGIRDHEAISQLFNFQLDLLAEVQNVIRFDRIVGQNVTVEMRLAKRPLEKLRFLGLNNLEEHRRDAYACVCLDDFTNPVQFVWQTGENREGSGYFNRVLSNIELFYSKGALCAIQER